MMAWMDVDQAAHLSSVRKTRNRGVSITHPVTVFISAGWPSPKILRKQRRSSGGMGLFG